MHYVVFQCFIDRKVIKVFLSRVSAHLSCGSADRLWSAVSHTTGTQRSPARLHQGSLMLTTSQFFCSQTCLSQVYLLPNCIIMLCKLVKSGYKKKVSKKSKLNAVEGIDKVVSKTLAVELVWCVKTGQEKRKRKRIMLCTLCKWALHLQRVGK